MAKVSPQGATRPSLKVKVPVPLGTPAKGPFIHTPPVHPPSEKTVLPLKEPFGPDPRGPEPAEAGGTGEGEAQVLGEIALDAFRGALAREDEEVLLDGDRVPAASRAVLRVESSFLALALGAADPFDSDFLDAPKGAQLASAVAPALLTGGSALGTGYNGARGVLSRLHGRTRLRAPLLLNRVFYMTRKK
jgi:hypothetical protein